MVEQQATESGAACPLPPQSISSGSHEETGGAATVEETTRGASAKEDATSQNAVAIRASLDSKIEGEEELKVKDPQTDMQSDRLPLQDVQNTPDDSGVGLHAEHRCDHVIIAPSLASDGNASSTVNAFKPGYKSPLLVAEEIGAMLPGDMYSIVHVRDAVESLDSEQERSADDNTLVSSETLAAISPHSAHESQSSENHQECLVRVIEESVQDSEDTDDREVMSDGCAKATHMTYEKKRENERTGVLLATSDDEFLGEEALADKNEELFSEDFSDREIDGQSPIEIHPTPPKRGKKRAQEGDFVPFLVREVEGDELSEEELFGEVGLHNVHPTRLRKLSGRPSPAMWLHPVFHVGEEDLTPRPLRHHIELLRHAIQEVPCELNNYKRLFDNIFGPVICSNREVQIVETVNTVLGMFGSRAQEMQNASHQLYGASSVRQLMAEDHFIYRYLSTFETFSAFLDSNTLLISMCSGQIMHEMHSRMANYLGAGSHSGYEYWAKARCERLHKSKNRPLLVSELTEEARKEWVEMLGQCSTVQETIDVSERFFGPLRAVNGFPTPHVDIKRYWNTCECGICQRTHKRARQEREEDAVATIDLSEVGVIVST